jgi:phage/plasmid-associated DNA primase
MFILYGTGANGKSTFLNVIQNILGDYALSTWAETFMKRNNDTATNDIARLRGARFGGEMDVIGNFLRERCVQRPGAAIRAGELFQVYQDWCEENNEMATSERIFGLRLKELAWYRNGLPRQGSGRIWRFRCSGYRVGVRTLRQLKLPYFHRIPWNFPVLNRANFFIHTA